VVRRSKKKSGCLPVLGFVFLIALLLPKDPDAGSEGEPDRDRETTVRVPARQDQAAQEVVRLSSRSLSSKEMLAPEVTVSTANVARDREIAALEAELKTIPARLTIENLRRYKRLVALAPNTLRYQTKRDYYAARLTEPLKVIGVHDGDSITLLTPDKKQIKVRLDGVDAPELKQEYGQKARRHAGALLKGSKGGVRLEKTGTDKYGRMLGKIYLSDGTYFNEQLVKDGYAWHFTKYNKDSELALAHAGAKKKKRGLWAADLAPLHPDEFRARSKRKITKPARVASSRKRPPKKEVSTSHWLNTKSGVRHNARCQYYGRTKNGRACNSSAGSACGKCGG